MKKSGWFAEIKKILRRTSLFTRIAVGNALVIVTGAFFGTLITRIHSNFIDGWLIIIIVILGISLSLVVNFLILRAALKPLRELQSFASNLTSDAIKELVRIKNPDSDTGNLASVLQSLLEQLEQKNQQLHALSERVISAQEEERKSISRSLHDDTGQALTMLIIHLDQMETQLHEDQSGLGETIRNARTLASNTLSELKRIVFGLRPTILDDLGLIPAIRWYAHTILESSDINVSIHSLEDPIPELPPKINTTLFRIAQEGINNIHRHAYAKNVFVSILFTEDKIKLRIKDDGKGIEPSAGFHNKPGEGHIGLIGLQERTELLGGKFIFESGQSQGTLLEVELPYRLE